jgi:FtsZ-binding cell division protein ZapB
MNANAQVARALAHVALVESRRRLIVETIQPPKAENAELNSKNISTGDDDAERAELKREVDRIVAAEAAEQERLAGLAIGSCI